MTTLDISELEKHLASLGLGGSLSGPDTADVLIKPLDFWRIQLANILGGLVGCDSDAAYKAVQWPNNVYNGDLAVVLPKLCQGKKAAEVAVDLLKQVHTIAFSRKAYMC
jgi:arginyl-tRNA synthetase